MKYNIADWSTDPAGNTDIGGIDITDAAPVNNALGAHRTLMAQVKTRERLTIVDYGAVPGRNDEASRLANNLAFERAFEAAKVVISPTKTVYRGIDVVIPVGRFFLDRKIVPPAGEGSNPGLISGCGRHSVLDIRSSTDDACFEWTKVSGPQYVDFQDFSIQSAAMRDPVDNSNIATGIGISGERFSTGVIRNVRFQNLEIGVTLANSFATTIVDCVFNQITDSPVRFTTNAHNLRFSDNIINQSCRKSGAMIEFADTGKLTHTIYLGNLDVEQSGAIILVQPGSGGLAGVTCENVYSEGFGRAAGQSDRQLLDFNAPVVGLTIDGLSMAMGVEDVPGAGVPATQRIDNVIGGRIGGVYLNKMSLHQGPDSRFIDWKAGNYVRGNKVGGNRDANGVYTGGGADYVPSLTEGWRYGVEGDPSGGDEFTIETDAVALPDASMFQQPRYRSTSDREVILEGMLERTDGLTTPVAVFQLPLGLRPDRPVYFVTAGSGNAHQARIYVNPNGFVVVSGNENARFSLTGVRFHVPEHPPIVDKDNDGRDDDPVAPNLRRWETRDTSGL